MVAQRAKNETHKAYNALFLFQSHESVFWNGRMYHYRVALLRHDDVQTNAPLASQGRKKTDQV